MERDTLLKRLQELEREVAGMRAQLAPSRSWKRVVAKAGMFLVSYWVLMSFFAAIATATYVKFAFNIDYFESYRNAAAVKRLSEFHREMGDEMFLRTDWKQALACYKASSAANPANVEAALGEVKCGVFIPEEGHKCCDPSISAAKLRRLRSLYPDDPQVAFLEAYQGFSNGDETAALARCEEVLAKHRSFAGGYLLKSYILQGQADFKGAAATLESLVAIDPENGMAHSNLGYLHLFTGERDKVLPHLEKGMKFHPSMVNAISLAEVHRSQGDLERAESLLEGTQRVIDQPGMEEEYFAGSQWLWNHLPEREGDVESPRYSITCLTIVQKRSVLKISQGLLAVAKADGEAAQRHFEEALKLEPLYRAFLINKMRAAASADKLDERLKAALREAADEMERGG